MLCCLLAVAMAGPLALWAAPRKQCCAGRRRWLLVAALGLCLAALGAGTAMLLAPVPFRHICQFIAAPRS